jgi:hypothetical protein
MIEKKRDSETLPSYLPCYYAEIAVSRLAAFLRKGRFGKNAHAVSQLPLRCKSDPAVSA